MPAGLERRDDTQLVLRRHACVNLDLFHQPLQLAVVASLAAVAAMNLSVIRFLDTPYEDVSGAVKPTEMRETLREMEADVAPTTAVPCNAQGRPFRGPLSARS